MLAEVSEDGGRVKLAGEEWSARSLEPGAVFAVGAPVSVVSIDGATAVVTDTAAGAPAPANRTSSSAASATTGASSTRERSAAASRSRLPSGCSLCWLSR